MPAETVTPGVTLASRKPDGYDIVIVDALPKLAAAVKLTVTGTLDFAAVRSEGAIINDARVTCPPMLPEPTPELAKSADVCTVTPADDPAFGAPSLQPVKVKV